MEGDVETRTLTLAAAVEEFLRHSVGYRVGRAALLLAQHPEIADYDLRTTVVLGDAGRVEAELRRDPGFVDRRDPQTNWTPLHAACASRWHLDPARKDGLLAVVRMLLDAGADPIRTPDANSQWAPLRCAVTSAQAGRGNEPIIELLLARGAPVADHDLYMAGFADGDETWCLQLLLAHAPDVRAIAAQAFAPPIGSNDIAALRLLLEAGADPNRYRDDDDRPEPPVPAAIAKGCDPELIELLIAHGARDLGTPLTQLEYACMRADRAAVERLLAEHPTLRGELAGADASALTSATERGKTEVVELLLEAGFPVDARGDLEGATALHKAAFAGSDEVVAQLLAAGAPLEARDAQYDGTPLEWAAVGSGERPSSAPSPDWVGTVRRLLDAGASPAGFTLSPDDPKAPSAEVAELIRSHIV